MNYKIRHPELQHRYRAAHVAVAACCLFLIMSCGEVDEDEPTPPSINGSIAACNVAPSQSIVSESERYNSELERLSSDSDELFIRSSQLGDVYDLGDFLEEGDFIRRQDVTGFELPAQSLSSISFSAGYRSSEGDSAINGSLAVFSGFAIRADVSSVENRAVTFESSMTISNIRLRQLSNTQEFIDFNRPSAPNANQFVYGVIEGEVSTTVRAAAQCESLTDREVQAAIGAFNASNQQVAVASAGVSGEFRINSESLVPIAYYIRRIVPAELAPLNLSAGIENDRRIVLQWDAVPSVQSFRVYFSQTPGFNRDTPNILFRDVSTNRFELQQSVDLGETWHFRVASFAGGAISDLSVPLPVQVPLSPPGTALFLVARARDDGNIVLSWDPPVGNDANRYLLFRREAGQMEWVQLPAISQSNPEQQESFRLREYVDSDVLAGVAYEYQIIYENLLSPPAAPLSNIVGAIATEPTSAPSNPVAVIERVLPVSELQLVTLNGGGSFDPNNDPLSFQWRPADSNAVAVALSNPNNEVATFVAPPIESSFVVLTFELTVSDGANSDREIVEVTIINSAIDPMNASPVVRLSVSSQEVQEGDAIVLDASESTDVDGDTLTFIWRQLSNMNFDTGIDGRTDSQVTINAPIGINQPETFLFLVEVSDGQSSPQTATVEVTVLPRSASTLGLVLGLESTRSVLEPGESDHIALIVSNTSEEVRTNVRVEAFFPTQFEEVRNGANGFDGVCADSRCNTAGESVIWEVGALGPGSSTALRFPPTVTESADDNSVIVFQARATDEAGATAVDSIPLTVLNDRRLELAMHPSHKLLLPGDTFELEIVTGFSQPSDLAQDVRLVLELPDDVSFRQASDGGQLTTSDDGRRISWALGDLIRGDTGVVTTTLTVSDQLVPGEQLRFEASMESESAQALPTNVSRLLVIAAERPMEMNVHTTHRPSVPGQQTEIFLTVTNPTTQDYENVVLEMRVDANSYAPFSEIQISGNGDCPGNTCEGTEWIRWELPSLLGGKSARFSLTSTLAASATIGKAVDLLGTYRVGGRAVSRHMGGTELSDDVGLELVVDVNRQPVEPGAVFRYTLHYLFNEPSAQLDEVVLTLTLPDDVTFLRSQDGGTPSGSIVTWPIGTLRPGEAYGVRTVDVVVDPAVVQGSQLVATARLAASSTAYALQKSVLPATQSVPLRLQISGGSSPLGLGEMHDVSVTVENTAEFPRDNVQVLLSYQGEWSDLSNTTISDNGACVSGSTCNFAGEFLVWNIGQLVQNSTQSLTFAPRVQLATTDNIIEINAEVRDASADRAWSAQSYLIADPSLNLRLELPNSPVTPGEEVTVEVHYGLTANGTVIGSPKIELDVPDGVTFVGAASGGVLSETTVEWNLSTLSPGQSGSVLAVFTVDSGLSILGQALKWTTRIVDGASGDENSGFTSSTEAMAVEQSRPLGLTISANDESPAPTDSVDISLEVLNTSTFTRSDIVISLRFPDGFNSLSNSLIEGGGCPGSACEPGEFLSWTIDSLGAGQNQVVDFSPVIRSDAQPGDIILIRGHAASSSNTQYLKISSP